METVDMLKKPNAEFATYKLNQYGQEKAKKITEIFDECLNKIDDICYGGGREMAIVRTKLEEACFFAKKAMASMTTNRE